MKNNIDRRFDRRFAFAADTAEAAVTASGLKQLDRLDLQRLEDKVKKTWHQPEKHLQIFQDILKPYSELVFDSSKMQRFGKREFAESELEKIHQTARVLKLCRIRIRCECHVAEEIKFQTVADKLDDSYEAKEKRRDAKRAAEDSSEIAGETVRNVFVSEGVPENRIDVKTYGDDQKLNSSMVRLVILSIDPQLAEIIHKRQLKRQKFLAMWRDSDQTMLEELIRQWKILVSKSKFEKDKVADYMRSQEEEKKRKKREEEKKQAQKTSSTSSRKPQNARAQSPAAQTIPKAESWLAAFESWFDRMQDSIHKGLNSNTNPVRSLPSFIAPRGEEWYDQISSMTCCSNSNAGTKQSLPDVMLSEEDLWHYKDLRDLNKSDFEKELQRRERDHDKS